MSIFKDTGGLMRDIEKLPDDESSRSCRRLIRPHVKFDWLIYDETAADSHADICHHAVPGLTSLVLSLAVLYIVPPFQKAQNPEHCLPKPNPGCENEQRKNLKT